MSELLYDPCQDKTFWIFGKDGCPFCTNAVELCKRKGVKYRYLNLSKGEWNIEELTTMLGYRPTRVPQIFCDKTHVGGFAELSNLL